MRFQLNNENCKAQKETSSGIPARATMALPSPVHVCAEVAEKYALP